MRTVKIRSLFLVWLATACGSIQAQNFLFSQADSLKQALSGTRDEKSRALIMTQVAEAYRGVLPDSSYAYAQRALDLSRRIHYPAGELKALLAFSIYFYNKGNLPQALEVGLKALDIARTNDLKSDQAFAMIRVGNVYLQLNDYRTALRFYEETRKMTRNTTDSFFHAVTYWLAAAAYESLNMPDSALYLAKIAYDTASKMHIPLILNGLHTVLANTYAQMGRDELALQYYRIVLGNIQDTGRSIGPESANGLARYYWTRGVKDSAVFYAKLAYKNAARRSLRKQEMEATGLLSRLFEQDDPQESLRYLKISNTARDSLYSAERIQALEGLVFQEKERQYDTEMAQLTYQNKFRATAFAAGLLLLLSVAIFLFRNNRHKQKVNGLLTKERNKLAETLSTLRSTQAQLVQSEKMASLGQLTAGIAHEIQNPLNFVNNFSDLNAELADELSASLDKGDYIDAKSIAADIRSNQQKILEHGRRADAIVKGMLQHSRSSTGVKEPTDINKLADEYLRLAYHGIRARDKNFNVHLETDFDSTIGQITVVPEDIGRVILNLINNAFYAVNEKKKMTGAGYEPGVKVTSKKINDRTEIRITDNGNGIPGDIVDKIFQPFFTTKPTGTGTGLGLSLSYEIVHAHGGDIKVETAEGAGTSFIIQLPNH